MFHHSLWGLGRSPNKHFAFVSTNALVAKYVFEKSRMACLGNVISFLINHTMSKQCSWLSIATNHLLGLPQTPVYAESILRLRVLRTLGFLIKRLKK